MKLITAFAFFGFALRDAVLASEQTQGMFDQVRDSVGSRVFDQEVRRLVNGRDATRDEVPFQVSLQLTRSLSHNLAKSHFCGGSLIADRWVLTAAHCVGKLTKDDFHVRVGGTDITEEVMCPDDDLCLTAKWGRWYDKRTIYTCKKDGYKYCRSHDWRGYGPQARECCQKSCGCRAKDWSEDDLGIKSNVKRIITHPEWFTETGMMNDIALVELETPMPGVEKVRLADYDDETIGMSMSVSGWGGTGTKTHRGDYLSFPHIIEYEHNGDLQAMDNFKLMSFEDCEKRFDGLVPYDHDKIWSPFVIPETLACVDHESAGTCGGDSGGPLYAKVGGETVLFGASSWSIKPCDAAPGRAPSAFVRVSAFRNWVATTVGHGNLEPKRKCSTEDHDEWVRDILRRDHVVDTCDYSPQACEAYARKRGMKWGGGSQTLGCHYNVKSNTAYFGTYSGDFRLRTARAQYPEVLKHDWEPLKKPLRRLYPCEKETKKQGIDRSIDTCRKYVDRLIRDGKSAGRSAADVCKGEVTNHCCKSCDEAIVRETDAIEMEGRTYSERMGVGFGRCRDPGHAITSAQACWNAVGELTDVSRTTEVNDRRRTCGCSYNADTRMARFNSAVCADNEKSRQNQDSSTNGLVAVCHIPDGRDPRGACPLGGVQGQSWSWRKENLETVGPLKLLDDSQLAAVQRHLRTGGDVKIDTDMGLRIQRDNSASDSYVKYIRTDNRMATVETFKLQGGVADHTNIVLTNGGASIQCNGNKWGHHKCQSLPEGRSVNVILVEVYMAPRSKWANDEDRASTQWFRNAFTFTGTKYIVSKSNCNWESDRSADGCIGATRKGNWCNCWEGYLTPYEPHTGKHWGNRAKQYHYMKRGSFRCEKVTFEYFDNGFTPCLVKSTKYTPTYGGKRQYWGAHDCRHACSRDKECAYITFYPSPKDGKKTCYWSRAGAKRSIEVNGAISAAAECGTEPVCEDDDTWRDDDGKGCNDVALEKCSNSDCVDFFGKMLQLNVRDSMYSNEIQQRCSGYTREFREACPVTCDACS